MHEALEVHLNLYSDTTVGTLRRFLSLIDEAPDDARIALVFDDESSQLRAIAAVIQ